MSDTQLREQSHAGISAQASCRAPTPFRRLAATFRNCALALPSWIRYRRSKAKTILVLGMHRSGTSCITRMIGLCGATAGDIADDANQWNKEGHWESLAAVEINDGLLRLSGGAWDNPPESITSDARLRWKIRGCLGGLHQGGTAVLKDPRMVITFPVWKPLLRQYIVVAAFRHPASVARSLQHRDGFDFDKALDLWRVYNERLLAICAQEPGVEWIDFDQTGQSLAQSILRVSQKAGLQFTDDVFKSYQTELRTSDSRELPNDVRIRSVYASLTAASETSAPAPSQMI